MGGLFPGTITSPQVYAPPINQYIVPQNYTRMQKTSNLIRVNGMDSAKAYPATPGSETMLFDENDDVMYFKETDINGYSTIRKFRFTEEIDMPKETKYVTVEDFEKFKEEILNGKQPVREAAVSNADDQSAEKQ